MRGIEKAVAGFAAAGPAVFKAREAALVEADGAGSDADRGDEFFLEDGENDERRNRDKKHEEAADVVDEESGGDDDEGGEGELGVPEKSLAALLAGLLRGE